MASITRAADIVRKAIESIRCDCGTRYVAVYHGYDQDDVDEHYGWWFRYGFNDPTYLGTSVKAALRYIERLGKNDG